MRATVGLSEPRAAGGTCDPGGSVESREGPHALRMVPVSTQWGWVGTPERWVVRAYRDHQRHVDELPRLGDRETDGVFYIVRATNAAGEGRASNEAGAIAK